MAGQGVDDGGQVFGASRHLEDAAGVGIKPLFPFVGDDDGNGLVGVEDGGVFDDVAKNAFAGTGGTDQNQGF